MNYTQEHRKNVDETDCLHDLMCGVFSKEGIQFIDVQALKGQAVDEDGYFIQFSQVGNLVA